LQSVRRVSWRDEIASMAGESGFVLAGGANRSYGDSALNSGGTVGDFSPLDRFIAFDSGRGTMRCESGVTLGEILRVALPRGWGLPVIPGTQFVTVGGAIANDVHGKNHGACGTFAGCVRGLLLWRSPEGFVECSPQLHPGLYAATLGGLGLTGAIVWAELQLRPQPATQVEVQRIPFRNTEEFLAIAASSESGWEYTVAWVDGLARGKRSGRGVFFRANHVERDNGLPELPARDSRWVVPFDFPGFVLSTPFVRAFNALYRSTHRKGLARMGFAPFFFPLDSVGRWNRIYGRHGFVQHQCVVPMDTGPLAIASLLNEIATAGEGSFLSVLKTFGKVRSPGLLSFPREGITLAMDFPMRGLSTLDLLDRLDVLVRDAGGAVYPAKDARMSPETFRRSFPLLDEFRPYVDPRFSSSFWRRVNAPEAGQ
jgi:FAD/FMN-containing dehydrogenase